MNREHNPIDIIIQKKATENPIELIKIALRGNSGHRYDDDEIYPYLLKYDHTGSIRHKGESIIYSRTLRVSFTVAKDDPGTVYINIEHYLVYDEEFIYSYKNKLSLARKELEFRFPIFIKQK